jgi:hypothetical protein
VTVNGVIGKIDVITGELENQVELGQPLLGDAIRIGSELVVPARDGTLLRVSPP